MPSRLQRMLISSHCPACERKVAERNKFFAILLNGNNRTYVTGVKSMMRCVEAEHDATKIQEFATEKQIKGRGRGEEERDRVK